MVIDTVGGRADLEAKLIRTIGEPEKRFLEDHLRILRAIRFAVQLDFEIDRNTFHYISKHSALIDSVSKERVREEMNKILTSSNPVRGIRLMDEAGLLQRILPEMETMKGRRAAFRVSSGGRCIRSHPDAGRGAFQCKPLELAWGCLLHDVAKPSTFVRAADRIRFHGHDKLGADMSRDILKRLTFPNHQIELICELVAEHLKFKDVFNMKLSTLKRFLALDRFDLHMELHRLDCMASHKNLSAYEFCKQKIAEFAALPPPPTKLVTGADLIEMGFTPGPRFTQILRSMEDAVLEGADPYREEAVKFIEAQFGKERAKK